jgi:hypothetical protein
MRPEISTWLSGATLEKSPDRIETIINHPLEALDDRAVIMRIK